MYPSSGRSCLGVAFCDSNGRTDVMTPLSHRNPVGNLRVDSWVRAAGEPPERLGREEQGALEHAFAVPMRIHGTVSPLAPSPLESPCSSHLALG
jgi:hypothetical protein